MLAYDLTSADLRDLELRQQARLVGERFAELYDQEGEQDYNVGVDKNRMYFTGHDLDGAYGYRNAYDDYSEPEDDSDEVLVRAALDRISKARTKGKTNVNLSLEEMEALERRNGVQQHEYLSPPATPKSSKSKLTGRSGSLTNIMNAKTRKRSSTPSTPKTTPKSNTKAKISRKNSADNVPVFHPSSPSVLVRGPDGMPMYAPLAYLPQEYSSTSRSRSRSTSQSSKRDTTPPDQIYGGYPVRYYPQVTRPASASSSRPFAEHADRKAGRSRAGSAAQYLVNDDYSPMPAAHGRKLSGPSAAAYSPLRRVAQASSPLATRPAAPEHRYSDPNVNARKGDSSSSSDDQGVQVEIVPDGLGSGYTISKTQLRDSETRRRKGRRQASTDVKLLLVATAAAVTGAALYLNGKYHVQSDLKVLNQIRHVLNTPKFLAEHQAKNQLFIYHALQRHALEDLPNHLFLEFEGRSWTYKQFYDDVQRIGNWLIENLAIAAGELVAIDGPNTAEFLMLSFALDAIGAAPAYINCNLTGAALEHCVKVCKSKHLIADRAVESLIEPSRRAFEESGSNVTYFDQAFFASLKDTAPVPRSRTESIKFTDVKSLIYTSGTTGFPKGTILTAGKMLASGYGTAQYLGLKKSDKMYTCLPLYHGSALALCIAPTVWAGGSVALGRKFSHKSFWPEVSASGANILQYVGELCRGAIAVRGFLLRQMLNRVQIRAKIDPDTEDIIKGEDGFIIKCKTGEPGEVLHKVEPAMKESSFRGYYNNKASTDKRWMSNVLKPDDLYFRSGDVMREDEDGRLYFVDRLGDTFRWKSENVSTNEVADTLGLAAQIAECSVYGVAVPNADGRCGCATVVLADGTTLENLDLSALARHVTAKLPRYAVPIFLRISPQLSYTGTFKVQKGQAKREGIDLDLIEQSGSKDSVFWLPPGSDRYQPFRREELKALREGVIKL
ncbi:hypothetical protein AMS68_005579 [Peltaster fructicola]|uniref:AMP-dependent synthetase/ligase domain-containing protein n=1 Tax=Peltaster fructicola TaxID=286661 RepID=A0A6H0XZ63_9PEZI|nr:hypothetical protein AMS68_005579 [Peltaster fructicola]